MKPTKWAIVSPGGIATKFATALVQVQGAELSAVCSRRLDRAQAFAAKFAPGARSFDRLDALLAAGDFDVAYVASPHPYHAAMARACLEAGKPVLCEKPMTMNAKDTAALVDLARAQKLFLMEAVWMRCMPALRQVKALVEQGTIGVPLFMQAQLTLNRAPDPNHRLFAPSLGGGSLLDLGIYPLAFAEMMFGKPQSVDGIAHHADTGVDDVFAFNAHYRSGLVAQMLCASRFEIPNTATIAGSEGQIVIDPWFHQAPSFTLYRQGHVSERVDIPHPVNGYEYEIQEVQRALAAGEGESPLMPLDTSLWLAETMDKLLQDKG